MPPQTNLLYFVCHDLGKHLGCYDAPVASPNLDAFAASGVRFTNAFCSSTACSPSRACAMTGKYAHVSGGLGLSHMGWPLAATQKTVVDYFNDNGYDTVHTGLAHERHPGTMRYRLDYEKHWADWDTAKAVDDAISYLKGRQPGDKPFYLNIGTAEVHGSVLDQKLEVYGGPVPAADVYLPNYLPDTAEYRRQLAKFQAAIRYLDTHWGRLLAALDQLGYGANTVVIFTTDHGMACPRSKGTLYDRGTEIALLLRLPGGARAGASCGELIPNIDLAPTVLDIAGIPRPADMNGRSFLPWLKSEPYEPWGMIFTERNFHGERSSRGAQQFLDQYDPIRAVRTRDYHYLRWFAPETARRPWHWYEVSAGRDTYCDHDCFGPEPDQPRAAEELYHLAHDPAELRDVATQPEYRHVKAELQRALAEWMRATSDPVLLGETLRPPAPPGWGPWANLK